MFPRRQLGKGILQMGVEFTYGFRITTTIFSSEANKVEPIIAPVITVSKLGPVESNLLCWGTLVISLFGTGITDISAPPL